MVGVHHLLKLHQMVHDGELPLQSFNSVESIVSGLLDVIVLAASGCELAENQLIAIKKLLRPRMYDLPEAVIKNIVERYYSSPHLVRGSYIRYLMYFLKRIVTPACAGKPLTTRSRVQLVEATRNNYPDLFEKAKPHWNKNSTLQSLAIRICLSEVNANSTTDAKIDERTLRRDLAILKNWESTHVPSYGDQVAGDVLVKYGQTDEAITWPSYSVNSKWSWFPKGPNIG
jgi:hypothetical protein